MRCDDAMRERMCWVLHTGVSGGFRGTSRICHKCKNDTRTAHQPWTSSADTAAAAATAATVTTRASSPPPARLFPPRRLLHRLLHHQRLRPRPVAVSVARVVASARRAAASSPSVPSCRRRYSIGSPASRAVGVGTAVIPMRRSMVVVVVITLVLVATTTKRRSGPSSVKRGPPILLLLHQQEAIQKVHRVKWETF